MTESAYSKSRSCAPAIVRTSASTAGASRSGSAMAFCTFATRLATNSFLKRATWLSRLVRDFTGVWSVWKSDPRKAARWRLISISSADSSGSLRPPWAMPLCMAKR